MAMRPSESKFEISKTTDSSDAVVLGLNGSLGMEAVKEWEAALKEAKKEGRCRIVLDLTKLDYISSAGVGTFVACIAELRGKGGDLIFVNPSEEIREVFDLLGFTKMFRIMGTVKDALEALKTS
jgi:anti-sigma B factor antagonist